jgi:hypothetical protein
MIARAVAPALALGLLLVGSKVSAETSASAPVAAPPKASRFQPLVLHDPSPPPTDYVPSDGRERGYYTGNRRYVVGPGLRFSPGLAFGFTRPPVVAGTLDLVATARLGLLPGDVQWVLVPELGASWGYALAGTFLTAGLGLGRGRGESRPSSEARAMFGGISYVPRFVLGVGAGSPAKGIRHGILWDHDQTTLGLEASHEMLWLGDGSIRHSLRAMVSIDLGRLLWLVL